MGLISGSMTASRYEIVEDSTGDFGDSHLQTLQQYQIETADPVHLLEEPAVGFTGGNHVLDVRFEAEKNIVADALQFGIRTDSIVIPGSLKRAWQQIELAGIMQDNLGGRPTRAQREQADEAVQQRCEKEAADGNFRRMNLTSVLWDAATSTLLLSSHSEKNNERCLGLIERAFGLELRRLSPTRLADDYCGDDADAYRDRLTLDPTAWVESSSGTVTWWNGMTDNVDYLGNEFLLWLWWKWETGTSVMELPDDTEVSGMFARSLVLDCPLGESGRETISSEFPTQLPESGLAIRMGKLPRKCGLTLVREGEQYDLSLQAETLDVGAARISYPGETMPDRDPATRIESIRRLYETVDLIFELFLDQRIGAKWESEAEQIRGWLKTETPRRQIRAA